jgi:hypothetical protein
MNRFWFIKTKLYVFYCPQAFPLGPYTMHRLPLAPIDPPIKREASLSLQFQRNATRPLPLWNLPFAWWQWNPPPVLRARLRWWRSRRPWRIGTRCQQPDGHPHRVPRPMRPRRRRGGGRSSSSCQPAMDSTADGVQSNEMLDRLKHRSRLVSLLADNRSSLTGAERDLRQRIL